VKVNTIMPMQSAAQAWILLMFQIQLAISDQNCQHNMAVVGLSISGGHVYLTDGHKGFR